jgi:lysozyme
MKLSKAGRDLIAFSEGKRFTAYNDQAGHATIGIGHLIKHGEEWMRTATLTEAQVNELFAQDVAWAEKAVSERITRPLKQNQFDALVSFVFNVGGGAFGTGTLDDLINRNASAEEISAKWMQYTRAGGSVSRGLILRRTAEVKFYWRHLWEIAAICLLIGSTLMGMAVFVTVTR